jgi:hypothetical protein
VRFAFKLPLFVQVSFFPKLEHFGFTNHVIAFLFFSRLSNFGRLCVDCDWLKGKLKKDGFLIS